MTPPREQPTTSGVTLADFAADPAKAIEKIKAEIKAEIRREIIGANLAMGAVLYLLLSSKK